MKFLSFIGKCIKLPFKHGIWSALLAVAVISIADLAPSIRYWANGLMENTKDFISVSDFDAFLRYDSEFGVKPEKEIELIKKAYNLIQPDLARASILISKQENELGYLKEISMLIEQQFSEKWDKQDIEFTDGRELLTQLAADFDSKDSFSKDERVRFIRLGGIRWVNYQDRILGLEASLARLAVLRDRVMQLNEKLEERRRITLRYLPVENNLLVDDKDEKLPPEFRESEMLLEKTHEAIFTTLHSIDPTLIEVKTPL